MGSRDLTAMLLNALDDEVIQPFFAVQFDFDSGPIRAWTGVGNAFIDGQTYTGTGTLLNISSVEETAEMAVRGATLTMTGIPSELLSLALQEPYQGRVCKIYFGLFAPEWILAGGIWNDLGEWVDASYWQDSGVNTYANLTEIFSGYMDEMNIDEGADFATIEMTVENKLIDLERSRVRRFSSGYQKTRYPGDKGLDFVEDLQDKEIIWGRSIEGPDPNQGRKDAIRRLGF